MTIRHLKIFIAVADCGKMRKAAEKLFISQPSVSQAIKDIEDYYDVKLFERLSQRLYITESGKQLLSYARYIVDTFDNMENAIMSSKSTPKIKIGGSVTVGTVMLHDLVRELSEKIQGIDIQITIDNTSNIEKLICSGELDTAIVEGMIDSNEVMKIPVCKDELVLIAGRPHKFFSLDKIELSDLENQSLISREAGSMDRNQFEQLLHEKNITMRKTWSCTNTEAIKNAVTAGFGIAILSKRLVQKEVDEGSLRILPIDGVKVEREFKLIYHKNKFISEPIKYFIEMCKNDIIN